MTANSGFLDLGTSDDPEFLVGGLGIPTDAFIRVATIDSATTDDAGGHTPTTSLRRGLLLKEATPGDDTVWNDGGQGTTELLGFLWTPISTLNALGVAEDKHEVMILRSGTIKESALPETLAAGDKTQLESQGFTFV